MEFQVANVLERALRVGEGRLLRRLKNYAEAVNHLEDDFSQLTDDPAEDEEENYSPVVIRHKTFGATPMTVDDALYFMELVGHDFYLFIDKETHQPSVVYRRKGWDYGVIGLDEDLDDAPEFAAGAKAGRSR